MWLILSELSFLTFRRCLLTDTYDPFQRELIEKLGFGKFRYEVSRYSVCVLVLSELGFLSPS